jgi:hypothetical protein
VDQARPSPTPAGTVSRRRTLLYSQGTDGGIPHPRLNHIPTQPWPDCEGGYAVTLHPLAQSWFGRPSPTPAGAVSRLRTLLHSRGTDGCIPPPSLNHTPTHGGPTVKEGMRWLFAGLPRAGSDGHGPGTSLTDASRCGKAAANPPLQSGHGWLHSTSAREPHSDPRWPDCKGGLAVTLRRFAQSWFGRLWTRHVRSTPSTNVAGRVRTLLYSRGTDRHALCFGKGSWGELRSFTVGPWRCVRWQRV